MFGCFDLFFTGIYKIQKIYAQAENQQEQAEPDAQNENGQEKLQKPETGESRNQNQNAESGHTYYNMFI